MLIRKLFSFEASHIVRNCSSVRCKYSLHGHSFKVELFLEAHRFDRGQMVYDFGLLKGPVRELIDSFDHAFLFWNRDKPEFVDGIKKFSRRWVSLPVSPTVEQLSRVLFVLLDKALANTRTANGEGDVKVHSVILHETATGSAQCFRKDAFSAVLGRIALKDVLFSEGIQREWSHPRLWSDLLARRPYNNPPPQ